MVLFWISRSDIGLERWLVIAEICVYWPI